MFGTMGQTNVKNLGNGGTMDGDVTITGDLTVSGGISLSLNEVLQGTSTIDINSTEALLVRKDGDGGDVFIVDTTNSRVGVGIAPTVDLDISSPSGDVQARLFRNANVKTSLTFKNSLQEWEIGNSVGDNNKFTIRDITDSRNAFVIDGSGDATFAGDITLTGGDIFSANLGLQTTNGTGTIYLTGGVVVNDAGNDVDFRVESDGNANMLFVDGGNNRVGIGTSSPQKLVHLDSSSGFAEIRLSGTSGGGTVEFYNDSTALGDIFFDTSKRFHVRTNGATTALTVDENQNIGIGTASPDYKLDVAGNIGINEHLYHNGDADTYLQMLDDRILLFAGGDEVIDYEESASSLLQIANGGEADINFGGGNMFIGGSQGSYDARVGIGSDSPNQFVEIKRASRTTTFDAGNSDTWADVLVRNPQTQPDSATGIAFQLDSNYHTNGSTGIAAVHGTGAYEADMVFITRPNSLPSSEKMRLTSGGFLNLGNSPTVSKNSHVGSTANGMTISGVVAPTLSLWDSDDANNTGHFFQIGTDTNLWSYNGVLKFLTGTSGTERMRINSSGNVGIGNSTPSVALDVTGQINASTNIVASLALYSNELITRSGSTLVIKTSGGANIAKLDTNSRISLSNNDGGANNTIFGYLSGNSLTTNADENVLIGHEAGKQITGASNVAVGYLSIGTGSTTGNNNVAVGRQTLQDLTSGTDNSALGHQAGANMITGNTNVAVGRNALVSATACTDVVSIGAYSMDAVTDSTAVNGTVAVGKNSLGALTSGEKNTAIGFNALSANCDIGDANTAVGYEALKNFDPSSDGHGLNTAVGTSAGEDVSTGTGNTLIGDKAGNTGSNDITTGTLNTVVGQLSGISASDGTNQTVIGRGVTGQADNSVTLGNADVTAVYMAQDSGATVHANGLGIGLGGSAPATELEIYDSTAFSGSPEIRLSFLGSGSEKFHGGIELKRDGSSGYNSKLDFKTSVFSNNVSTKMSLLSSGVLSLTAGIQFPDSQVASSDANTLDDYEEGEYTGVVTCGTSGTVTITSSQDQLSYTKIGNQVTVNGLITVGSVSSPTGFFKVNLPFAIGSGSEFSKRSGSNVWVYDHGGGNISDFVALGVEGESFVRVYFGDASSLQSDSANILQQHANIVMGFTYFV
jgi:hypothetical protein